MTTRIHSKDIAEIPTRDGLANALWRDAAHFKAHAAIAAVAVLILLRGTVGEAHAARRGRAVVELGRTRAQAQKVLFRLGRVGEINHEAA